MSEAKKISRPIYTFKFPAGAGDFKSIGMVEITATEEIFAEKRAQTTKAHPAEELAKQAIVEVDGQAVSAGDGTVDSAWNRMKPKERTLAISAYHKLHIPSKEEEKDFFSSMEVKL